MKEQQHKQLKNTADILVLSMHPIALRLATTALQLWCSKDGMILDGC
jgi:hypothetical protein